MITVSLLGCDRYVAMQVSKESQKKLADLYEIDINDIIFYAPESFLIHDGVEQTSYQLSIVVHAPLRFSVLEKNVAEFLSKACSNYSVHISIRFNYFDADHEYNYLDLDYPRYITETNMVQFQEEDDDEDVYDYDEEDGEEPFLGNAFEALDSGDVELDEEEHECECGEHHKHDGEHECDGHQKKHGDHCCCGHHHDIDNK